MFFYSFENHLLNLLREGVKLLRLAEVIENPFTDFMVVIWIDGYIGFPLLEEVDDSISLPLIYVFIFHVFLKPLDIEKLEGFFRVRNQALLNHCLNDVTLGFNASHEVNARVDSDIGVISDLGIADIDDGSFLVLSRHLDHPCLAVMFLNELKPIFHCCLELYFLVFDGRIKNLLVLGNKTPEKFP